MENLIIRLEEPKDYRTVEELTRTAFNNPDRIDRSKIGCPMEHHMVHRLREKDGNWQCAYELFNSRSKAVRLWCDFIFRTS